MSTKRAVALLVAVNAISLASVYGIIANAPKEPQNGASGSPVSPQPKPADIPQRQQSASPAAR